MATKVAKFRYLHAQDKPLALPNAWDAGSARLFESLGAAAIATTSAGVAWSLGYQDGRQLPISEVTALAFRIMHVVSVPVTFDIENGYSDDPKLVASYVMRLADLGIAGINIEDGRDDPALLANKVGAIRAALSKAGLDLFVNIRTDVILAGLVEQSKQLEESIKRGKFYANVGADGLFLPGIAKAEDIQTVAKEVPLPLNVMALPGLPDSSELGRLGVRRLSAGTGVAQAVWGKAKRVAADFMKNGQSAPLFENAMGYTQLQDLF